MIMIREHRIGQSSDAE